MVSLEIITIELAIIRGVALNASFSPSLFSWLAGVVKQACSERRNVRVSIRVWYPDILLIIYSSPPILES